MFPGESETMTHIVEEGQWRLGVDLGGSMTKVVLLQEERVVAKLRLPAREPATDAEAAVRQILREQALSPDRISTIALTGLGMSSVEGDILGIPTHRVGELSAIGQGGLHLSGLEQALVVSMGTGTAFIRCDGAGITHLGGSGVGGGTLTGLGKLLLGTDDAEVLTDIARTGELSKVDLTIADLTKNVVTTLPPYTTVSNFAGCSSQTEAADLALGLLNMIYQTVGIMAVLACKGTELRDIVVTGSVAGLPQAGELLGQVAMLHNVRFIIPEDAPYATAIGAVLNLPG